LGSSDFHPLVEELSPSLTAAEVFRRLSGLPHALFLDSALRDPVLGRYSFVAADPFDYLEVPVDVPGHGTGGLEQLARRMSGLPAETVHGLPPFQGGAAGLLGYDLGRQLEVLPVARIDEFKVPAAAIGFYDVVVAFDHASGQSWIISQGFPLTDPADRSRRAESRLRQFHDFVYAPSPHRNGPPETLRLPELRTDELAPGYPTQRLDGLVSNFAQPDYLNAVRRAIEYIYSGDIFEVNLSQRLIYPAADDSVSLYLRLRARNPAPFAGYFDLGDFQVVSASPERFLQVSGLSVEARPIKGTRRRTDQPEADRAAGEELLNSEKDRAENVMIVDLLRNDLSRVCRAGSVKVSQLCGLESYAYVQHLVSAVRGELQDGNGPIELIAAAFPGGSITGAPKVRAMEIIAELEPTARGAYCGSLGYLGFDGSLDLSILIRTVTAGRGWWQMPVGGAIVAQSIPEQEYQETWHKAEGMIQAIQS
jgi:para-aminobenzoate synthetase component 1